jgi:hypothetical protein
LHLEKFEAVSIATLTKLSVRAVPPGEVLARVSVIDAHHDGVHTVAFASQKFGDRTRISVIGCSWRDNFDASVPVEHYLEADVGELVPVKPESKGLQELHGCIEPLGCNGEHNVMHHWQRAWHRISTLGQGGYDVSKHRKACKMSGSDGERSRPVTGIEGKVVAITWASSGIGQATAILLAQRGAKLVLGARNSARLEALTERITDAGRHYGRTDVTRRGGGGTAAVRQARGSDRQRRCHADLTP